MQGEYETYQQDIVVSTEPKLAERQLELKVECSNPSNIISPVAPAEIFEPHSAPPIPKPMSILHKDLPGQVLEQPNSDHNTSLSHIVMETPPSDGNSWRKYGQKQVKGSKSSRSYYRCSHSNCHAKKKVQRCDHSGRIIDVVYIGHHDHDVSRNKCNLLGRSVSSVRLAAGSLVDSVQKLDSEGISICAEDARQSSVHVAESEQLSSSSSNGNVGIKVEEQNSNDIESTKL
uniref:WRKY transcription factor n=1 Tax=Jatropha curcas TaxID=180498 RepID=M1J8E3_JATCU|nr:WRKY transcription factor [Jatropha curcas]